MCVAATFMIKKSALNPSVKKRIRFGNSKTADIYLTTYSTESASSSAGSQQAIKLIVSYLTAAAIIKKRGLNSDFPQESSQKNLVGRMLPTKLNLVRSFTHCKDTSFLGTVLNTASKLIGSFIDFIIKAK